MDLDMISFAGEISDLDFRIDSSDYYPDIPTFLNHLYDSNCQIYTCPT